MFNPLKTISTHLLLAFTPRSVIPATLELHVQHGKNQTPYLLHSENLLNQLYFSLRELHFFIQQILVYSTNICAYNEPGSRYMVVNRASATHNCILSNPDDCTCLPTPYRSSWFQPLHLQLMLTTTLDLSLS